MLDYFCRNYSHAKLGSIRKWLYALTNKHVVCDDNICQFNVFLITFSRYAILVH